MVNFVKKKKIQPILKGHTKILILFNSVYKIKWN